MRTTNSISQRPKYCLGAGRVALKKNPRRRNVSQSVGSSGAGIHQAARTENVQTTDAPEEPSSIGSDFSLEPLNTQAEIATLFHGIEVLFGNIIKRNLNHIVTHLGILNEKDSQLRLQSFTHYVMVVFNLVRINHKIEQGKTFPLITARLNIDFYDIIEKHESLSVMFDQAADLLFSLRNTYNRNKILVLLFIFEDIRNLMGDILESTQESMDPVHILSNLSREELAKCSNLSLRFGNPTSLTEWNELKGTFARFLTESEKTFLESQQSSFLPSIGSVVHLWDFESE